MYDVTKVQLWKVSVKSFGLGISMAICINLMILGYDIIVPSYIVSLSVFHLLEFLITAIFNTSQIEDDSFILGDYQLLAVNIVSLLEYFVWKRLHIGHGSWLTIIGGGLIIVGQGFRTIAMITAGENFNHYIQRNKADSHTLVTTGVYRIVRHPSYFGFFWWFIGLRIFLGSWISLMAGGYKIWQFFHRRIDYEEQLLMGFFDDYSQYKSQVSTGIPFITGAKVPVTPIDRE